MVRRRQSPRFDIVLPCRPRAPESGPPNRTLNISAQGALLRHPTDRPALTLELALPDGMAVSAVAVARHVQDQGQGVEFVVMSRSDRARWESWLDGWARGREGERRRSGRAPGALVVWASGDSGMHGYPLRNISVHGMFLHTPSPLPIGTAVDAVLVDPEAPRGVELSGRVVWRRADGPIEERGIGAAFDDPQAPELEALIGS